MDRDDAKELLECLKRLKKSSLAGVKHMISQLPDYEREAGALVKKNYPSLTEDQVEQLLPPSIMKDFEGNTTWTVEDEKALQQRWEADPARQKLEQPPNNTSVISLYKACIRLMHCLPTDIINRRRILEYDLSYYKRQRRQDTETTLD
jgi:hypothetical protein